MKIDVSKIIPGIYHLPVPMGTLPPHTKTNCFAVVDDASVIIDGVAPHRSVISTLQQLHLSSLQYAAITHPHPDHIGGLNRIVTALGGDIICHTNAVPGLRSAFKNVDICPLQDGDTIATGKYTLQALSTPGHSSAHLCFYIEEEGLLFTGDVILGWGTSIISPPEGNMADYMNTLNRLLNLDIDIICPGHGPIIKRHAKKWIQWYFDHRKMRENRIIAALKLGLDTVWAITRKVYTEEDVNMYGPGVLPLATRSVLAHLKKLEYEGKVTAEKKWGKTKYVLTV